MGETSWRPCSDSAVRHVGEGWVMLTETLTFGADGEGLKSWALHLVASVFEDLDVDGDVVKLA